LIVIHRFTKYVNEKFIRQKTTAIKPLVFTKKAKVTKMIKYQIQVDKDFLTESFNAYRDQRGRKVTRFLIKSVIGLFLLALSLLLIFIKPAAYPFSIFFLFVLAILIFSHKFDLWLYVRRCKKSPFFDHPVEIYFDAKGVRTESTSGRSELPWQSIKNTIDTPMVS